jgi:2'-5' RNA ligase
MLPSRFGAGISRPFRMNQTLQAHYDTMRQAAIQRLAQGDAELDPLLDYEANPRMGITLLTRLPAPITAPIEAMLADFRQVEPEQYYYPASDIHLTIMSIISCYSGFRLTEINSTDYQDAVRDILRHILPFTITFAGLTASPGGIMVQGFFQDDTLSKLRAELRTFFRGSGLQQSIDQRYSIQTAHSTVLRFRSKLRNGPGFLEKLSQYQHQSFGSFEVNSLELVYSDWYQRAANTVLLEEYAL